MGGPLDTPALMPPSKVLQPLHSGPWGRGRPYSDIYGREGARRGPEASSGRKGKGALGGGHQGPFRCPRPPARLPESTPSQGPWLTSFCAWEFPAQGWSQAQTLELDQGILGSVVLWELGGPSDKRRGRKTREQGAHPDPNPRVGI